MANENNKTGAIALIIALITSLGITVGPDVFDGLSDYYVCEGTGVAAEFKGGISGTGLSGYPNADNRIGAQRCYNPDGTKSKWVQIEQYAADNGVTVDDLIGQSDEEPEDVQPSIPNVIQYKCPPNLLECYPV